MLTIPDYQEPFRIMSIDPGTVTLGVAIIDVDVVTLQASLISVVTHRADRMARSYTHFMETHGDRATRLKAHEDNLLQELLYWRPTVIICEGNYLGRFANAFQGLVECVFAIRNALFRYDPAMSLEIIDPMSVKELIGASGRRGRKGRGEDKKELVRQGVMNIVDLYNPFGVDYTALDEHSVDAIAIGYYKYRQVIAQ